MGCLLMGGEKLETNGFFMRLADPKAFFIALFYQQVCVQFLAKLLYERQIHIF
jgi:hypothetical protein